MVESVRRCGIEALRRLNAAEQALLRDAAESVRERMGDDSGQIHWLNLYVDRAFTQEYPQREALHAWVGRLVAEVYGGWSEVHLLSYGFFDNPAGSGVHQKFHVDYTLTDSSLYIPLTPVSLENATRFLRRPLDAARFDDAFVAGTIESVLDAEQLDAIEVVQVVCRPFTLLQLLPGTAHAGIPNRGDYDRLLFFVTVDTHWHPIRESATFKFYETRAALDAAAPRLEGVPQRSASAQDLDPSPSGNGTTS